MPETNLAEILKHIALAGLGGFAKYLNEYLKGSPFLWKMCLAKLGVCCFIGMVFSLLFSVHPTEYSMVASALAGYAGTEVFDALVHAAARATGRSILGVDFKMPRRIGPAKTPENEKKDK